MADDRMFQNINYNIEPPKKISVLPPGTEENSLVYGTLFIQFGQIFTKEFAYPLVNTKLRLKFWGQNEGRIFVTENCAPDLKGYPTLGTYEIRCPLILFHKYLQDMVRIRIDLLDKRNDKIIGSVIVNTLLFLKAFVDEDDNTPFEDLNGIFPITKPQLTSTRPDLNQQIGEIEVHIWSVFESVARKKSLKAYEDLENFLQNEQNVKNVEEMNYFERQNEAHKQFVQRQSEKQQLIQQRQQQYQQQLQQQLLQENQNQNVDEVEQYQQQPGLVNQSNKGSQNQLSKKDGTSLPPKANIAPGKQKQQSHSFINQQLNNSQQLNTQNQPQQQNKQGINISNRSPSKKQSPHESLIYIQNSSREDFDSKSQDELNILNQNQNQQQQSSKMSKAAIQQPSLDLTEQQIRYQEKKQQEEQDYQDQIKQLQQQVRVSDAEILDLMMDEAELYGDGLLNQYLDNINGYGDQNGVINPDNLLQLNDGEFPDTKLPKNIKDTDILMMKINSFKLKNQIYKGRLKNKKVYIECDVPCQDAQHRNVFYNSMTLASKEVRNQEWIYNHEYPQKVQISEDNLYRFLEMPFLFRLLIEEKGGTKVQFATGQINFEQLLLREQFQGKFLVGMEIHDISQEQQDQQSESKTGKKNKKFQEQSSKVNFRADPSIKGQFPIAGEIDVYLSLESSKNINNPFAQILPQIPNSGPPVVANLANNQISVDHFESLTNIPCQALMYIQNGRCSSQLLNKSAKFFLRYKLYGSTELFQSEEVSGIGPILSDKQGGGGVSSSISAQQQVQLTFNYKTIYPVSEESVKKMQKIPLIIEVWVKQFGKSELKEELHGLVRLNLQAIHLALQQPNDMLSVHAFKKNLYPLIAYDNEVDVTHLTSHKVVGQLKVIFAFGTISQINKFEKKIITIHQVANNNNATLISDNQMLSPVSDTAELMRQRLPQQQNYSKKPLVAESASQQFDGLYREADDENNMNTNNYINDRDEQGLQNYYGQPEKQQQQLQTGETPNQAIQRKLDMGASKQTQQARYYDKAQYYKSMTSSEVIKNLDEDLSTESASKCFVFLMENIRRNKKKAQKLLRQFVITSERQNQKVTLKEFYNFLMALPFNSAAGTTEAQREIYCQKLALTLDFENRGEIIVSDFSKSFNSYTQYEEIVRERYCRIVKEFKLLLQKNSWTPNDLDRHIIRYSEFGFIQKGRLKDLLATLNPDPILLEQIILILDPLDEGLILGTQIGDYIRNSEVYEGMSHVHAEAKVFNAVIVENFQEYLVKEPQLLEEFINNSELFNKSMSVRDVMELVEQFGLEVSFWEALCIIDNVKDTIRSPNEETSEFRVSFISFSDWLNYLLKKGQQEKKTKEIIQEEDDALEIANLLKSDVPAKTIENESNIQEILKQQELQNYQMMEKI